MKFGRSKPNKFSIKVFTQQVSKGLEFPVVALVGAGACPPRAKKSARRRYCSMWRLRG